jgi:hypothetical protein
METELDTMDKSYGDGSNHKKCPQCSMCITCGDCDKHGCGYQDDGEPYTQEDV